MKIFLSLLSFFLFLKLIWGQGSWIQISNSKTFPFELNRQTAIYFPLNNSMLIFGGYGMDLLQSTFQCENNLWSYNISQGTWLLLNPLGSIPSSRQSHSAIYIPNSNSMLIFGGNNAAALYFNDLWEYNISSNFWTLLNVSGSIPSPRSSNSAVYSPQNNSMTIFGGINEISALGDLWNYDITTNVWNQLNSTELSPSPRCYHSTIYLPQNNSMLIFGGFNGSASFNELWRYDITNNIWYQLNPSGIKPSAYISNSAIYYPIFNSMFIFGGGNGSMYVSNGVVFFNKIWQYDIINNVWIPINSTGVSPVPRYAASAIYSPLNNSMLIYGGTNALGIMSDFWSYNFELLTTQQQITTQQLTTQQVTTQQVTTQQVTTQQATTQEATTQLPVYKGSWLQLFNSEAGPFQLNRQTAIYSPLNNSMLIFGGYGMDSFQSTFQCENNLWSYNISQGTWLLLNPLGSIPSRRQSHSAIYIPNSNSMLIFGGNNAAALYFNDLWEYNISSNFWTLLNVSGSIPSPRSGNSAVYSPQNNSMTIFGGINEISTLGDLWNYDITTNVWNQLNSTELSPSPRCYHSTIYLPQNNSMLIFGGFNGSASFNELWRYDIANNIWYQLNPSGIKPSAYISNSAIYYPIFNSMFIFGGSNGLMYVSNGVVFFNKIWQYDIINNVWIPIDPTGVSPVSRYAASAIYSPLTNSMLIYGGTNALGIMSDFWSYNFELLTTQQQLTTEEISTQVGTTQEIFQAITTSITNGKLNTMQITGIIIGSVLGVLLIFGILILILIIRKKKKSLTEVHVELENNTNNELKKADANLIVEEKIGQGNFGEVYKGMLGDTPVALKILTNKSKEDEVSNEIEILSSLHHPNIVRFFGMKFFNGNKYMVMEFMNAGSLLNYIRKYEKSLQIEDLFDMTLQIAQGMEYLEEKKIIHKDLALRNVLCSIEISKLICKVSDFGLSKMLSDNLYYDTANSGNKQEIPIKWSAPELLFKEKISLKIDVFSFGVVLFEIFSKGQVPWLGHRNQEVVETLRKKERMPIPKDFGPDSIVLIMLDCWKEDPHERPTFKQIFSILQDKKENILCAPEISKVQTEYELTSYLKSDIKD